MKMKRAINWLVASAQVKNVYEKKFQRKVNWRVNFITLTIPKQGDCDDRKVKRLFNELVKWAQYNYGFSNYVWKAELQKRGDLHLHIMSDCYIHHTNLRFKWNQLLGKFNLLNGHNNPNSTDIHAVIDEGVRNLTAYCLDYMQKKNKNENGEQLREIKGRLWGCSKALSNAGKQYISIEGDEAENLHKAMIQANWKPKQIEGTASMLYMIHKGNNPYKFITAGDPIHDIYRTELKMITSHNTQLLLFERQAEMRLNL